MKTKLILASPECDYKRLLCKIASPMPRQVYIVDGEYRLLGIVSAVDLLKQIMPSYMNSDLARSITDGADFLQKKVEKVKDRLAGDIMVKDFVFLRPHHQLLEADALIVEKGFNTLPVLDDQGKLLGEVTRRDILLRLVDSCLMFDHEDTELVDLATV
ncbi:CBS domain-containing protein [Desulfoplanes sp.]